MTDHDTSTSKGYSKETEHRRKSFTRAELSLAIGEEDVDKVGEILEVRPDLL